MDLYEIVMTFYEGVWMAWSQRLHIILGLKKLAKIGVVHGEVPPNSNCSVFQ